MWSNGGYAEQPSQGSGALVAATAEPAHMPPPGPLALQSHPAPASAGDSTFDVPATLMERIELCKFLAGANLLPPSLREAPANLLLIMHKALALHIPLSVAIDHMHVIDGKVGHSAELLRALLYRHGHILRWIKKSDREVEGELVLRHDPRHPRRERFAIADATRMGLTGKTNWQKDPESMMIARCTTRLVGRHAPEVALALGNLSAIDFDDDPADIAPPSSEPEQSLAAQAAALHAEALSCEDPSGLQEIGGRAREAGLLETPVEGHSTLMAALLHRIGEIQTEAEASEPKAAEERPVKGGRQRNATTS